MTDVPKHIPPDEHVGTHLLYEDDEVRIWSIILEPGETARMHTHRLDYAVVMVNAAQARRGNADGSVDILENERGMVRFDEVGDGQQHDLTNIGGSRYRNVIVELKQRA